MLNPNLPYKMQNSKMAASEIQDVCPKTCIFPYNSKCIDFKTHKHIKVEYKVGHCGYFGTKYVSVSITVIEIQHICPPEYVKVPMLYAVCCISRTVIDTDMYLVPNYPQCPTLYSTLIHVWVLKSMHLELLRKKHLKRINFQRIRTPKKFCEYLFYTTVLGVLRDAESKYAM